jgi:hypothetical protein
MSSVQNPKCRPFVLAGKERISQFMDSDIPQYRQDSTTPAPISSSINNRVLNTAYMAYGLLLLYGLIPSGKGLNPL